MRTNRCDARQPRRLGKVVRSASMLVAATVLASTGVAAHGAPAGEPAPSTMPPRPAATCATVAPDYAFDVPSSGVSRVFTSYDAAYSYRSNGCDRFVVDVRVSPTSYSHMLLRGAPYDLPSSAYNGGSVPTTQPDCQRLQAATSVYRRLPSQSAFTLMSSHSTSTTWTGSSCVVSFAPSYETSPSHAGTTTYRVAVRVSLRSSGQQAGVFIGPSIG